MSVDELFMDPSDRQRINRDAVTALQSELQEGEKVEITIPGPWSQAMLVTNRQRVLIYKKGFMAGSMFGTKMTSWSFSGIHGIQSEMGFSTGVVALQVSGGGVSDLSYWSQGSDDPYKTGNAIPIVKSDWKRVSSDISRFRKVLAEYHEGIRTPRHSSVTEQLTSTQNKKFCFSCGAAIRVEARFCEGCGQAQ